jgi:short-subunit dehydrogenase
MSDQEHRLVLTGASGGLGKAFAAALAPLCSVMILSGRNGAVLQALQQKLQSTYPDLLVRTIVGDLTQPPVQQRLHESCRALSAPIDLLINAAGISDFAAFERQEPAAMERLVMVNLLTPIQVTQRLLPLLKAAPSAQIINIGSIFGYLGHPGFALYCATKFGLRGFSQALRRELSDTRVAVRYFAPRAVKTDFNSEAVSRMNRELHTTEDDPQTVADQLVRFLGRRSWDRKLGFPERLYVWLNGLAPAINDQALRKRLTVIRRHLGSPAAAHPSDARSRS